MTRRLLNVTFAVSVVLAIVAVPHEAAGQVGERSAITTSTTARVGEEVINNRLAQVKSKSDLAVKSRIEQIGKLKKRVNESRRVTDAHKVALAAELAILANDLEALNVKIQASTELEATRADAKRIVTDFRVYVVETPKVNQLLALDAVLFASDRLLQASDQLTKAVDALQASGKDVTAARAAAVALRTKIENIQRSITTQIESTIALTAAGYPGNATTLQAGRAAVVSGRDQLKSARNDMVALAQILKS